MKNLFSFTKEKRFKVGTLSSIVTLVVIIIAFLTNIVLNIIVEKFPVKIDLTNEGIYNLSKETNDYLVKLENNVEIIVLEEENAISDLMNEPLKNYTRLTSKISIKYVNVNKNPLFLSSRGIKSIEQDTAMIVYNPENKRFKTITSAGMFATDPTTGQTNNDEFTLESSLTSAILYVSKKEINVAYFVEGHGETYSTVLEDLLIENGYEIKKVNLLTLKDFEENAKYMFINAPTKDLSEDDILKVNNFLNNSDKLGRNAFIFADVRANTIPILNNYLQTDWGIKIENKIIMEIQDNVGYINTSQGQLPVMLSEYSNAELGKDLVASKTPMLTILSNTKPITIIEKEKGSISTTPLVSTTKDAFLKDIDSDFKEIEFEKKEGDPSGVFDIVTISTKSGFDQDAGKELKSNLIVGGTTSLSDEFLSISNAGNADYFLNILRKVSGLESPAQINILPKYIGSPPLKIESNTIFIVISVIIIFIIPILLLSTGIFLWLRRRHL